MTINKLVSIIIVNYNGEKYIKNCLDSVLRTKYCPFEIVVVDNGSTDKSVKILKEFENDPRVKVILLGRNLHFAGGNNLGIKYSNGEYIVFLNNDTIMKHDCLEELVKRFESDRNAWAVQCLLLKMHEKGIDSIGGTLDYCGGLLPASLLWSKNSAARRERRLFWGCGAALCVRRDVLERVGYFDPEIPTDEVDLCWRINLAGGKIVLEAKAVVYHLRSASFGKGLKKERLFLGELSRLTYILKNYELRNLVLFAPYIASYLLMSIGWDLIYRRKVDIMLFRLKAYAYVLKNLKKIFIKRLRNQRLRKVSDVEIKKLMIKPNPFYYIVTQLNLSKTNARLIDPSYEEEK
jgi:GT2 family glycosyltransferase